MNTICELFKLSRAKSELFRDYVPGDVAYVGNSGRDNTVVGYVTPCAQDKVFTQTAIVLTAFCEASVQLPPFIACGRSGNGLLVLEPRSPMKLRQLAYVAAYINEAVSWRFNWYRQITLDRVKNLKVPFNTPDSLMLPLPSYLPSVNPSRRPRWQLQTSRFGLEDLFDLNAGEYHALNELQEGNVPVVSCGEGENGIAGFYDVPKRHQNQITIALNGSPLLTRYHPYPFAAKDDVAICTPKQELQLTTLLFIQVILNRERWRYSYYRKCYMAKLRRIEISLPSCDDQLDEDTMAVVMSGAPYWRYLDDEFSRRLGN